MEFPVCQNLLVNHITLKLLVVMQELMEYVSMLFQLAQKQKDTVDYKYAQMLQHLLLQVSLYILDVLLFLQLHLAQQPEQDVFHIALVDLIMWRLVVFLE